MRLARAAPVTASRHRSAFSGPEGEYLDLLRLQAMAQGVLSRSAERGIRRLVQRTSSPLLKATALVALAKIDRDPQPLLQHLAERDQQTQRPLDALIYCQALARHRPADARAPLVNELVAGCGTAGTVRLGAYLLFQAGQYAACRILLDAHAPWFPGGVLPADLSRQRIRCLLLIGELRAATDAAQLLTDTDASTTSASSYSHAAACWKATSRALRIQRESCCIGRTS